MKGRTELGTWHSAAEKCLLVPSVILARRHITGSLGGPAKCFANCKVRTNGRLRENRGLRTRPAHSHSE